jgi:hypothetical protein
MSPLKRPDNNVERAIRWLRKQLLTGGTGEKKSLVLQISFVIIAIGVLLISTPLLFEGVVLRQPQCEEKTHPTARWIVEEFFLLVDKIGEAAVIAGLIGIAVDRGEKSRLIKEVVEEASPLLIGRHLPDNVRISLLEPFNANFIRPAWDVEYEISPVKGLTEYICVTSRVTGIVMNCSSLTQDFVFFAAVDASPRVAGLDSSKITRISMSPEAGGTGGFDESPDNEAIRQPDGSKAMSRRQSIRPGERWKTALEAKEYRPVYCSLPLFVGTMVVKATVRVRFNPREAEEPEESQRPVGFKVSTLDFQVSTGIGDPIKPDRTTWGPEWSVDGPILPGQAIVTLWNPKSVAKPQ